jgi:hypothetical protein
VVVQQPRFIAGQFCFSCTKAVELGRVPPPSAARARGRSTCCTDRRSARRKTGGGIRECALRKRARDGACRIELAAPAVSLLTSLQWLHRVRLRFAVRFGMRNDAFARGYDSRPQCRCFGGLACVCVRHVTACMHESGCCSGAPCARSLFFPFVRSACSVFFSSFIFLPWPLFHSHRRVPPIRPLPSCPSQERALLSLLAPALIPPPVRTMHPPPTVRRAKRQTSS